MKYKLAAPPRTGDTQSGRLRQLPRVPWGWDDFLALTDTYEKMYIGGKK